MFKNSGYLKRIYLYSLKIHSISNGNRLYSNNSLLQQRQFSDFSNEQLTTFACLDKMAKIEGNAGLIYRMVKPKIVLLIIVSGKVVLTRAKRESDIHDAYRNIYVILKASWEKT